MDATVGEFDVGQGAVRVQQILPGYLHEEEIVAGGYIFGGYVFDVWRLGVGIGVDFDVGRGGSPATGADGDAAEAEDQAYVESQSRLFRAQPNGKVVLIPHARHDIFASNEAEVLRAVDNFVDSLP